MAEISVQTLNPICRLCSLEIISGAYSVLDSYKESKSKIADQIWECLQIKVGSYKLIFHFI